MELHTTQKLELFLTGKTGIKYLKSPFLSNKKKIKMTTLINSENYVNRLPKVLVAMATSNHKTLFIAEDNLIADLVRECTESQSRQNYRCRKMILPSWCDSHTHNGNREQEFVDRINGPAKKE
jgi:hypothetical protein